MLTSLTNRAEAGVAQLECEAAGKPKVGVGEMVNPGGLHQVSLLEHSMIRILDERLVRKTLL